MADLALQLERIRALADAVESQRFPSSDVLVATAPPVVVLDDEDSQTIAQVAVGLAKAFARGVCTTIAIFAVAVLLGALALRALPAPARASVQGQSGIPEAPYVQP